MSKLHSHVYRSPANRRSTIRESYGDRVFITIIYVVLSMVLIVVLYPLIYIVSSSLRSPAAVSSGEVWLWPIDLTLD
ncbi:hypothetical protein SB781_36985, partial [Paraburkholderia sp. SIMBA_061]